MTRKSGPTEQERVTMFTRWMTSYDASLTRALDEQERLGFTTDLSAFDEANIEQVSV